MLHQTFCNISMKRILINYGFTSYLAYIICNFLQFINDIIEWMLNDQSSFTDKKSRKKYLVCTLGFFLTKNKNVLLMSTELKQNVYICIFKKQRKKQFFVHIS